MNEDNRWNGQNIPRIHENKPWKPIAILPVLEFLLNYDEDTVGDLLPSAESYGWDDSLTNEIAWANNYYKISYFEPDFERYGCLPRWFPDVDREGRLLSDQGRVDRFLCLLDSAFGGFLEDHTQVNPKHLVEAILELHDNMGEYVDIEAGLRMQWELADDPLKPKSASSATDQ